VTDASGIAAYERDPLLRRLETDVVAAGEDRGHSFVVLADTILYHDGGGQPADRGTVGGIAVLDVRKVDGDIRHFLDGPAPTGRVTLELDWARRFDHMQQHTGQHLLTAVAQQRFGWSTTAFHLGEHLSDIEVDVPGARPGQVTELEEMVAAEIRAARSVTARCVTAEEYARLPVRTRGLPEGHEGRIRLVEIEGLDLNTCGGTHVATTAEIEALKLLGTEPMRGGTRLFYAAGTRLRRLHAAHHERNARLRELLSTSDDDLVAGVAGKLERLREAQRDVRALEEELAAVSAQVVAAGPGRVLSAHWPRRDLPFLQRVAREISLLAPDRIVLLTTGDGEEGAFVVGAGDQAAIDVPAAGRKVAEVLGGRGGGAGRIFQGKATRLSRREEATKLLEQEL
jgi:misacylated tRNA(Ala) deacylase